ncbi:MAG TPA: hypothetical protein VFV66_03620 [Nonomuraea sp.]|nr:hypothetical protein [Nonomuraea sp.]
MGILTPVAGPTKGSRCPKTVLSSGEAGTLTVTDRASGHSATLAPATLYHYTYNPHAPRRTSKSQNIQGLAALDADGLVLLDLPGDWHAPHLRAFARQAGIPLVDARSKPTDQVRTLLAGRAPGWRRVRGLPRPLLTAWRKPVTVGAGIVAVAVMAYLAYMGMWVAWRGIAFIGRLLLDIIDVKWLGVLFSPALLIIRPARAKIHRRRIDRGSVVGPPEGPYLVGKRSRVKVIHRNQVIADLPRGVDVGDAFGLLLYRHEDVVGLAVRDRMDHILHHLPGPWPPNDVDRFAKHQDLLLAVESLPRDEYVALIRKSRSATP